MRVWRPPRSFLSIAALHKGLFDVVAASLLGSILSNLLLVLGERRLLGVACKQGAGGQLAGRWSQVGLRMPAAGYLTCCWCCPQAPASCSAALSTRSSGSGGGMAGCSPAEALMNSAVNSRVSEWKCPTALLLACSTLANKTATSLLFLACIGIMIPSTARVVYGRHVMTGGH